MVDKSYMLEKPPGSGVWKQYLYQSVLPKLIDAAGCVEAALEYVAVRVRHRPLTGVGAASFVGLLLAGMFRRSTRCARDGLIPVIKR